MNYINVIELFVQFVLIFRLLIFITKIIYVLIVKYFADLLSSVCVKLYGNFSVNGFFLLIFNFAWFFFVLW